MIAIRDFQKEIPGRTLNFDVGSNQDVGIKDNPHLGIRAGPDHGVVNCRFLLIIGNVAYGFRRPRDAVLQLAGKLLAGLPGWGIVG